MFSNLRTRISHKLSAAHGGVRNLTVVGQGKISLSSSDFAAQGGEGSVYVKGAFAYKLYHDPSRAIKPAKINELSVLSNHNVIRPLAALVDRNGIAVGYSMKSIPNSFALCRLFPKAFRIRNNVTPGTVFDLVSKLQSGIIHIHSKNILIVDLNEMNFVVGENLNEIYFIDVDSYQTLSFPATVLMESVRDRHSRSFSRETDWFSFAIVSFQMFTGIHPYKGTYEPFAGITEKTKMLDERMKANISVLHPGVRVPPSCQPFNVIPTSYLQWYQAIFEEGKRIAPPDSASAPTIVTGTSPALPSGTGVLRIKLIRRFSSDVQFYDGNLAVTTKAVYLNRDSYDTDQPFAAVILSPRLNHLIGLNYKDGALVLRDLSDGPKFESEIEAEQWNIYNGTIHAKHGGRIFEVGFIESASGIKPVTSVIANIMPRATTLFSGVAFQSMLGGTFATIFYERSACAQIRLSELDGYRIVDAGYSARVLLVFAERNGKYDRFVFRFNHDFSEHDVRTSTDVMLTGVDFVVLDSGVCVIRNENDDLELISSSWKSSEAMLIHDGALSGMSKLYSVGNRLFFSRGESLYSITMK